MKLHVKSHNIWALAGKDSETQKDYKNADEFLTNFNKFQDSKIVNKNEIILIQSWNATENPEDGMNSTVFNIKGNQKEISKLLSICNCN